jgi:hypothetical protein
MICHYFPRYTFIEIDNLVLDEWSELASGALWLQEEESKQLSKMMGGKGKNRK